MGTATPKQNGLAVLGKYMGVSATQTIVEYATFAILHLIGVPSQIANGIAVVCSATYNFVMNRNVTFKSSNNFTRSVALFVLLWIWNFTFSTLLIGWMPGDDAESICGEVHCDGLPVRLGLSVVQVRDF